MEHSPPDGRRLLEVESGYEVGKGSAEELDPTKTRTGRIIGYISIAVLLLAWVCSTEVLQELEAGYNFNQPLFITYADHLALGGMLPLVLGLAYKRRGDGSAWAYIKMRFLAIFGSWTVGILACLGLSFTYLIVNVFFTEAYKFLPASVATAISEAQCAFAYIFSVMLLGTKFTWSKGFSVVACLAGAAVIMMDSLGVGSSKHVDNSGFTKGNEFLGVVLVLIFCVGWALYTVLYDKYARTQSLFDVMLVLTVYGWIHLLLYWPTLLIADLAHAEKLVMPVDGQVTWLFLQLINSVVVNTSLTLSISFSSPLVVSVALVAVVPLTFVADIIVRSDSFGFMSYLGALLILAGFAWLQYVGYREAKALEKKLELEARATL